MTGNKEFAGCVALVTGAASGIGASAARWLDAQGIGELVLVDIDRPALDRLGLSCKVHPFGGDVSDPSLWKLLEREVPRIDYAVLNAGIASNGEITDLDITAWRKTLSVNLDGMFLSLRTALRAMKRANRGAVVLTASVSGIKAAAGTAAYSASKAATIQLAKVAAAEAATYGVRVNAIAPGRIATPMVAVAGGQTNAAVVAETPLRRLGTPEEVARAVCFLTGPDAEFVTGQTLDVAGGWMMT